MAWRRRQMSNERPMSVGSHELVANDGAIRSTEAALPRPMRGPVRVPRPRPASRQSWRGARLRERPNSPEQDALCCSTFAAPDARVGMDAPRGATKQLAPAVAFMRSDEIGDATEPEVAIDIALRAKGRVAQRRRQRPRHGDTGYYAWVRGDAECAFPDTPSCPKARPTQMLFEEIRTIHDFFTSKLFGHMSTRALALYAQRAIQFFGHPTTWYRTVRDRARSTSKNTTLRSRMQLSIDRRPMMSTSAPATPSSNKWPRGEHELEKTGFERTRRGRVRPARRRRSRRAGRERCAMARSRLAYCIEKVSGLQGRAFERGLS